MNTAEKTGSVPKSLSIREYLTANPEAKAKDVVEALGKTGIEVNEGLVYSVKGAMKEKSKRKKKIAKAAMASVTLASNGQASKTDAITLIRDAKELAGRAGGYRSAQSRVDPVPRCPGLRRTRRIVRGGSREASGNSLLR